LAAPCANRREFFSFGSSAPRNRCDDEESDADENGDLSKPRAEQFRSALDAVWDAEVDAAWPHPQTDVARKEGLQERADDKRCAARISDQRQKKYGEPLNAGLGPVIRGPQNEPGRSAAVRPPQQSAVTVIARQFLCRAEAPQYFLHGDTRLRRPLLDVRRISSTISSRSDTVIPDRAFLSSTKY